MLCEPLETALYVEIPVGDVLIIGYVCKSYIVRIGDKELVADLIVLE